MAAPEGFGKTVALRHFVLGRTTEHVYLRVRPAMTLLGLLRELSEALAHLAPGANHSFAVAYERAMQSPAPVRNLAAWFGGHVAGLSTTVVLEDVHNGRQDALLIDFVTAAIESTPDTVRWIVTARSSDVFPIASWLARGDCDVPVDETALAIDLVDAAALSDALGMPIAPAQAGHALALSGGRPAAFVIALMQGALESAGREHLVPAMGADAAMVPYDVLARRYYAAQPLDVRQFLTGTIVVDEMDRRLIELSGRSVDVLERFAACAPFLLHEDDGTYRYDGDFRRALADLARAGEPDEFRNAVAAAANALELLARPAEALLQYARCGESASVCRLLERHGLSFIEKGRTDAVETAIAAVPDDVQAANAVVLTLRAIMEAQRGRFDTSEAWFQIAIDIADEPARVAIADRYGLELMRRGRTDCIELLERFANARAGDPQLTISICATLATAYAGEDRPLEAQRLMRRSLAELDAVVEPGTRARILHQAAFVAIRCGQSGETARFAQAAVDIALEYGLFDVAARAYTMLYEAAYILEDDIAKASRYIDRVAELSLKSGNAQVRLWALLAAYYLEAERGDAAALRSIEALLNAADVAQNTRDVADSLLPAQALRAAWYGDFANAYRLSSGLVARADSDDRRALRWAELALYAAAAGLRKEARAAAASALGALRAIPSAEGRDALQAWTYVAVALVLLGRLASAERCLERLDGRLRTTVPTLRSMVRAARTAVHYWSGKVSHHTMRAVLDTLREHQLGGIAMLFEALPVSAR